MAISYYPQVEQDPLEQEEHPDLTDEEAGTDNPLRWSELVAKVENTFLTFLSLQCGQASSLESLPERTSTSKTFLHFWH